MSIRDLWIHSDQIDETTVWTINNHNNTIEDYEEFEVYDSYCYIPDRIIDYDIKSFSLSGRVNQYGYFDNITIFF